MNNKYQKQETSKPSIEFLDCTNNIKVVVSHQAGCVFISAQDHKHQQHGFIAFQLKSPYAKNYQKLAQALNSVSGIIEEQLDIREA